MENRSLHKGDKTIWGVFFILALASLVLIYSASSYIAVKQHGGNNLHFLFKQLIIIGIGYATMMGMSRIKYSHFQWGSKLLLFVIVPLLLLTAVLGTNINNASRWLTIPFIGISFQSSDFAKIVLLAFLARSLSKLPSKYEQPGSPMSYIIVGVFAPAIIVSALILRSNLSTSLLVFISAFYMMWLGEVKFKYLASLVGLGIISILIVFLLVKSNPNFFPRFDTWVSRIENFQGEDKDANYQITQAKIAIASNPLFGSLPGKSSQRAFLPSAHADFIYAIIIEEYGTIIGFGFIILYLILFYRGMQIARKSETPFWLNPSHGDSCLVLFFRQ